MKLIQITDLHFVPPGEEIYGLNPRARLEACITDINENHGDAAYCLITGDLADRGTREAYAALKETLEALAVPYRLMLGNHDNRNDFRAAFPDTETDENGFAQSVVICDAGNLILLDTHEPNTHAGRLCARRQAWLRDRLDEAGGRAVYIFMHHPPFDIGIPSLDRIRLDDGEVFAATLNGSANVKHIFCGHVHRPVSGSWRGIAYSALRSTVHQVPLDLQPRRRVRFSDEPPAYAVIFVDPEQTTVHFHDYLHNNQAPAL